MALNVESDVKPPSSNTTCALVELMISVFFYTPVERQDVLWNGPVRPSTIPCESDILKIACRIDFTFWYGLNTTKTWDAIVWGILWTKMAATAV